MKLPANSENLVMVRAGKSSLHGSWLADQKTERNWDIVVSYFDRESFDAHTHQDGVVPVYVPGGKWDGIFSTINKFENLKHYKYVWLPDDDIEADCETVNKMFEMMRTYELSVAQPSLSPDSYFSTLHVVQCNQCILRYSNFVEIMVPCLRMDVLLQVLPDFEFTLSGYGIDTIWHRLEAVTNNRAAILDNISVLHTRPIGSQLRSTIANRGTSSGAEGIDLRAKYGNVPSVSASAYKAILRDGSSTSDTGKLARFIAANQLRTNYKTLSIARALRKIVRLYLRQRFGNIDLSPLRRTNY